MATLDLKYTFNKKKNEINLYNHRMVTTSIYYNAFMQETVLDSGSNETIELLSKAAIESTLTLLTMYFNEHPDVNDDIEKLKIAGLFYQGLGYGLMDLTKTKEEGGIIVIPQSNVVEILKTKFNKSDDEICYYSNGFALGSICSIYKKPLDFYKITDYFDFVKYGYKIKVEEA